MKRHSRFSPRTSIVTALAATALLSGGVGLVSIEGVAQAKPGVPIPTDDNGWGPPKHWCPGQQPLPATGNHVTDPLHWDWNVCHTYYFLYQGMGNVSNMIWDGDNPPPKPPPPVGLYCNPVTLRDCRIGDHP